MSGVLPNHKGDTLVGWRHSDWAESSALTLYRHCEHLTFQPHVAVMVCVPRPERRTARPRALLTELRPRPTRGITPPPRAAHWLAAAPTPGGHCETRVSPEVQGVRGGWRGLPAHPHYLVINTALKVKFKTGCLGRESELQRCS